MNFSNIKLFVMSLMGCVVWHSLPLHTSARSLTVTILLHGVSESKVSLMPLSGKKALKPIAEIQAIKNGETVKLQVPEETLPGEFVLRFDYKEKQASTPYPAEKYIFINNQDLELCFKALYCMINFWRFRFAGCPRYNIALL